MRADNADTDTKCFTIALMEFRMRSQSSKTNTYVKIKIKTMPRCTYGTVGV
jgi:hypothetical protein